MPTYTEPEKPTSEPQWLGAIWKNLCGVTWKDLSGMTWKTLCKVFGSKVSSPTYTENEKGTVTYTEPSKE